MFVWLPFLGTCERAELFVAEVFLFLDLVARVLRTEVRVFHEDARPLYLGKFFPWVEYFGHSFPNCLSAACRPATPPTR